MIVMEDRGFAQTPTLFDFTTPQAGSPYWDVDGALTLAELPDGYAATKALRIHFGGYADGRGFTLAAQLRCAGYQGHLRAAGPLIADQYAMARRSGFDDVQVQPDIAERQTEDQWLARADWRANSYQNRLRGGTLSLDGETR